MLQLFRISGNEMSRRVLRRYLDKERVRRPPEGATGVTFLGVVDAKMSLESATRCALFRMETAFIVHVVF